MTLASPSEWAHLANCREMQTADFYPDLGGHPPRTVLEACAACDVQPECLEWGLTRETYGVWGGLTESQRVKLRIRGAEPPGRSYRGEPPPHGTASRARWDYRAGIEPCAECRAARRDHERILRRGRDVRAVG